MKTAKQRKLYNIINLYGTREVIWFADLFKYLYLDTFFGEYLKKYLYLDTFFGEYLKSICI